MIKAPQPSESVLQSSIVNYLRLVLPGCIVAAIPNAARRTASGRAGNAVAGLFPGFPDLQIVSDEGRSYFLEVKTERGRLSPAQEQMRERFMRMGVPYAVVRSLSDVKAAVAQWRLPSREVA